MSKEPMLAPEVRLLLAVADYFDAGGFLQFNFVEVVGGQARRCTQSAIELLGRSQDDRRLAKQLLAEYLASADPDREYTAFFTNGKLDAEETIMQWNDHYSTNAKVASAMIRAAANVLPIEHTPTPISLPEGAG